jgi:hypothetical protein
MVDSYADAALILRDNIEKLSDSDQAFASSLLQQLGRRGSLSEKQWPWVVKLADRAVSPKAARPIVEVGDMTRVLTLFSKAKKHLKYPKVVLALPNGARIRLWIASDRSKYKGSVMVADYKSEDGNIFYGRIVPTGQLEYSYKCPEDVQGDLRSLLISFANDPAAVATAYARLHGHCCFCMKELKRDRSTDVGYGPDCAKHYGLPW